MPPAPGPQTGRTLALTGPPRVPVRVTNQPAPAPLVVTQAPPVPEKGRIVIGPIRFEGPPRHKASTLNAQQKFWMEVLGSLVLCGVATLILMRKLPLWRDKLKALVQGRAAKRNNGPRLVLDGAPQRQSPLGED